MVNDGHDALDVFDLVPLAKGGSDGGFRAGSLEVIDGSADGFHGDPVGAADIVEQRPPAAAVGKFRVEVAGDNARAGSADDEHAGFAKRGRLKTGDTVAHKAGLFPRIDFATKFLFLIDRGLVKNPGSRDRVADDLVGEGKLQFQFTNQFVHAAAHLFLVGTGKVHGGGMNDSEDAAVEGGSNAVAVCGAAIDANYQW